MLRVQGLGALNMSSFCAREPQEPAMDQTMFSSLHEVSIVEKESHLPAASSSAYQTALGQSLCKRSPFTLLASLRWFCFRAFLRNSGAPGLQRV